MADSIVKLNDENFKSTIETGICLVDFYADWCGPCKMMAPILGELATEFAGKITIAKLDIEKAQTTTASFRVTSIPTLIIFKDGKEVERIVGLKDKESLKKTISRNLNG